MRPPQTDGNARTKEPLNCRLVSSGGAHGTDPPGRRGVAPASPPAAVPRSELARVGRAPVREEASGLLSYELFGFLVLMMLLCLSLFSFLWFART